ncbi:TPA: hypothetical protein DEP30_02310 [Candidatus Nomurabacteria bacterium]|nr:MAG: hypothetical protein UR97_C0003G0030 [Candidatus Nomurabacteria bacterium GW2011_GWE2_36_115]KKP94102.1 MAG: hypothetical protein US00_C0003G0026 [Candidatus Nomurabacteria bacterium GW2011_GWF2_36_126]KKP96770.1 MAG: hypothetical protein US04_C0001G0272 [Candidatus Nomurabacteria bacterium GW2011_GWD2_36_14]KKP99626.1 MAG: hypothetical protein US08_C0001G0309 [Candidatus Nomurabacteria bacterium GW2011_GWF2_36_19]KKQ05458.1 MAG: hypothetical protein US17_C0004G0030 [Candidatus Nomuraba
MNELKYIKTKNGGWFKMGNVFIDQYAKLIGPIGTSIYLCLKRHSNSKTRIAFPSEVLISEELHINPRTVIRHLPILEKYGFIKITKTKSRGQWVSNQYYLTHSKDWATKPSDLKSQGPYD